MILRAFGWLFLALAAAALWADWAERGEGGLTPASIGQRWYEIHETSLIGLQSGLENRVNPDLFFDWVLPVLELPAAPSVAVLGAGFLLVARLGRR